MQKATKAIRASVRGPTSLRMPAAPGAANTRRFLIHCLGRASLSSPTGSDDGSGGGASSGSGRGAEVRAGGSEVAVMAGGLPSAVGRDLPPHRPGQVAEDRHQVAEGV